MYVENGTGRTAIVFEAGRDGYSIDQIADNAITVADLRDLLDEFPDDALFILSHDRGYTYGSISRYESRFVAEAQDPEDGTSWEEV